MTSWLEIDLTKTEKVHGLSFFNNLIGYKFIPKVASTSLKQWFHYLEYGNFNENVHLHYRDSITDIENCQFKFLIVRDPVKRFLSVYNNQVIRYERCSRPQIKRRHPNLFQQMLNHNFFNPSLSTFIKHLNFYRNIWSIKHHTDSIVDLINYRDFIFDKIYPIENLNEAIDDILHVLKSHKVYKSPPKIPRKNATNFFEEKTLRDISEEELNEIITFYEKDYQFLEERNCYSREKIIHEWKIAKS